MAQLKIILPLQSTLWSRNRTDRPNVGIGNKGTTVKRVPELLQPYVTLEDWIEFCDKLTDSNKKENTQSCFSCCGLLGVILLLPGAVLAALHGVYGGFNLGFVMIGVGIVLGPTCAWTCWNVGLEVEKIRSDACSKLSDKLKTILIFYRVYKRPKYYGKRESLDVQHQLEVIVTDTLHGRSTAPFFHAVWVERTARFCKMDHWKIRRGTGHETPGDFAAAYRAAIATTTTATTPPTKVTSGTVDNCHGRVSSKATLLEQLDAMKKALLDEQYGTVAAKIPDFVRSIDELHNNEPSDVIPHRWNVRQPARNIWTA